MKRAAISITSNIAEGFDRKSMKEKIQFYYQAHGSLAELKNQLIIARDIRYLSEENFQLLFLQLRITHALLQGLIKNPNHYF